MRALAWLVALVACVSSGLRAQPATRAVVLDREGVLRWRDTNEEVALFGANYTLPSAGDFRAAGYLGLDRKKLVDEDMAHFARMGWNALRISFWGDWENTDRAGNLIANEHLDLLDYLIAKARERGIYMLLSPITTYSAEWPDSMQFTGSLGFANHFRKSELGTKDSAITAQVNYVKQILNHVNPYTGLAYRDDPAIPFVEPINEPIHHSRDVSGSIRYIDALVDAVRGTGSRQLVFHNLTQDFAIGQAIRRSRMQGITLGWYPSGLVAGYELQGNFLRSVDEYVQPIAAELAKFPRLVYEFDTGDIQAAYLYPAMTRTFRGVGSQFVAMFAYDMLRTASRNLGWQTHYLNLVYTPRKAISAIIAGEVMRRVPRERTFGPYPQNTRFGDFRVSYEENTSELVAADAFMYAASTRSTPPRPDRLRRIVGFGSSPVVRYDGAGVYFLDKVREGVWRLEVYPDAVSVRDPFEPPSPDKIVTRAIHRSWPMRVELAELGTTFTITPVAGGTASPRAANGAFEVRPGVFVLSAAGPVERSSLPARLGNLAFDEFHAPSTDSLPVRVVHDAEKEHPSDRAVAIVARVVDDAPPDSVWLFVRPAGTGGYWRFPMRSEGAYDYRGVIPDTVFREGVYEYVISMKRGAMVSTFPQGVGKHPWAWGFTGNGVWTTSIVAPRSPVWLFEPATDVHRLAFTRIGDNVRQGIFRLVRSSRTGNPALHLEIPVVDGRSPSDYTASLVVKDRISSRGDSLANAQALTVRLRGLGARQTLHVTLMEKDGTSWSVPIDVDSGWTERTVPLSDLVSARGVLLPQGFPGEWAYWLPPAAGRGGAGDAIRPAEIERLQLSLRGEARGSAGKYGVEIEAVTLHFDRPSP